MVLPPEFSKACNALATSFIELDLESLESSLAAFKGSLRTEEVDDSILEAIQLLEVSIC